MHLLARPESGGQPHHIACCRGQAGPRTATTMCCSALAGSRQAGSPSRRKFSSLALSNTCKGDEVLDSQWSTYHPQASFLGWASPKLLKQESVCSQGSLRRPLWAAIKGCLLHPPRRGRACT